MNIKIEDITLRAIEETDLPLLLTMINDAEIENSISGYTFPLSYKQQKDWFENLSANKNELRVIIDLKNRGAIGTAILSDIDWKNRNAEFHFKIISDENVRGCGYGTKAAKALLDYAFKQLGLHCIFMNVLDYNKASQRVAEKCGFKKEGILRKRVFKNGDYHDIVSWSLLEHEFKLSGE